MKTSQYAKILMILWSIILFIMTVIYATIHDPSHGFITLGALFLVALAYGILCNIQDIKREKSNKKKIIQRIK